MLERFKTAKRAEIDRLEEQSRNRLIPPPFAGTRPSLAEALKRHGPGAVIAEFKPASPSQGPINPGLRPEDVASAYASGGAAALSVLTEETYFQGSLTFLERMTDPGLPLLRKDFLFHPLQIKATAATPASALLLVVAMFEETSELADMIASCADHGLEAVVEIFAPGELDRARAAGARIIQVNNRNLETLEMNPRRALNLIGERSDGEVWIAASGVSTHDQWKEYRDVGFDGILIGTSLMRSTNQTETLRTILGRGRG